MSVLGKRGKKDKQVCFFSSNDIQGKKKKKVLQEELTEKED
jgi:hypothetical protein